MRDDWRAWLSEPKTRVNDRCELELEACFGMLGVPLNEAVGLRIKGDLVKAYESVRISRQICDTFTRSLGIVLEELHRYAKHSGIVPSVAPLDPANFLGSRGQRTARFTGFLNRVLLSQRAQFIHKVATLRGLVADLGSEFGQSADDLLSGLHARNDALWDRLIQTHFDLNTCMCETRVLLKSFLVALPEDQLEKFESELKLPSVRTTPTKTTLRNRRFTAVSGK